MKVCFLVLAHHQPAVFQRLLRNIAWKDSDVVVHVDRGADMRRFPDPGVANIHFMQSRRRVHWGGWSLTKALIDGLAFASQVSDADYFIFLAGTDFPVRPRTELIAFLQRHQPVNFLNYYPLVPGIWGYGLIDHFRFNDLKSRLGGSARGQDTVGTGWRRVAGRLVGSLEVTLKNRRSRPRDTSFMPLYSGSTRWCLNRETVQHIIDYFRAPESKRLRRFLRFCANSDEILVQTTVMNSRFKDQCTGFDAAEAAEIFAGTRPPMADERRVYLHYIDWSADREDPAILTEADWPALQESNKFFACKFTDARSLPLIDAIERQVHGTDGPDCHSQSILQSSPSQYSE